MKPPRRTPKLLAPRDVTETARQGQGIGDIEAMKQIATKAAPELLGMAPGIGEAMSLYDAGKSASQGDALGTGLGLAGAVPMAGTLMRAGRYVKRPIAEAVEGAIRTWHASGSDTPFPKFLREFYGRGAGGDRLGRAVYSTEAKPEGITYLREVTKGRPSTLVTERGNELAVPIDIATDIRSGERSLADVIAGTQAEMAKLEAKAPRNKAAAQQAGEMRERLRDLLTASDEGVRDIRRPGTLYELELDVDRDKLLNFDRDLIDQSPFVQEAVQSSMGIKPSARDPEQLIAYNRMLNKGLRTPDVSQRLEDAGIQGVVGRSQMPGAAKNYAIFNPDRVNTIRTLGLLGLLTGGGAMANRQTPPNEPR